MSFLIKIHSPSHKRVPRHSHVRGSQDLTLFVVRYRAGNTRWPFRGGARTREDRRSATRESMCYPRENKTRCAFVVLFLLRGVARRAARASRSGTGGVSPPRRSVWIRTFQLRKAWSLSSVGHHDGDYGVAAPRRLIEPDVGPGVWLGLGLGAGWHDRPGPNDRWIGAGDAPLRHDGSARETGCPLRPSWPGAVEKAANGSW